MHFYIKKRAECMACGRIHPHYRFSKNQIIDLLYCKGEYCGTRVHFPICGIRTKCPSCKLKTVSHKLRDGHAWDRQCSHCDYERYNSILMPIVRIEIWWKTLRREGIHALFR